MRWDDLFADLEAQLQEAARGERAAEIAELVRSERAGIGWVDRLASGLGKSVVLHTKAGQVTGQLTDVGRDWVAVEESGRGAAVLPTAAIRGVSDLPRRVDAGGGITRSFGLGVALRGISRDRSVVAVHDVDAGVWIGTIDLVGADHLDVALHPADAVRRTAVVTSRQTIPWASIAVVRRIS
ncbi:hypothetical protein [Calidifontibacter terrae]